jgi:hypothetical protein
MVDGEVVGEAGPTSGFGEVGLLFSTRRSMSVRCCEWANYLGKLVCMAVLHWHARRGLYIF